MKNLNIPLVNLASCTKADLIINGSLAVGAKFRLVGRTPSFQATALRTILGGTVAVVDGVSDCGRFKTTARVIDTAQVVA
ncbi:hypothetical protein [Acidovorax sp. sic0104]|uniref:hypothetical protein n=1 Tax=Acidovorax sp. sic0104 TaxID=2854784 RepID=UPI001C4677ED|nr:hypothetical protein [Acidovorax sp. sic0104]MBV7542160.1 hypothetical protein [Acidovorax sp. sic0104]